MPLKIVRVLFESAIEDIHRRGPEFVTRRIFPKSYTAKPAFDQEPVLFNNWDPLGIVVQGPITLTDDFTVETVKHYLSLQPRVRVIVSTWESEDSKAIECLKSLGADVVISQIPAVSGRSNVNRQAVSSLEGIKRAKELGCCVVAKTRSDQRVNSLSALMALPILLKLFPKNINSNKHSRLIALSFGTSKWTPLFLADQFMFGMTDEMLAYWAAPTDTEEYHWRNDYLRKSVATRDYVERSPEHYLLMAYLEKMNIAPDYSVSGWWRILAEHFIIVDRAWLDIYWPKYSPNEERPELIHDGHIDGRSIKYADWLNLYYAMLLGKTI